MKVFETVQRIADHINEVYPRKDGYKLMHFPVSDSLMLVSVYQDEDLDTGFVVYQYPASNKWVMFDSVKAEMAVRHYMNYIEEVAEVFMELEEASTFERMSDDGKGEDSSAFFEDLDI